MEDSKFIKILGIAAAVMAILMYVSYLPQIMDNLSGAKGNPLQPLVAMINSTLWFIYGIGKKPRDFSIAVANFPGIIFGAITFLTAI
ncbi:SemiSWEET family transporter [Xylocopilactobacillus apicola]|uniref:Membrane protein n=1 Tax=Xylocopilactobacillus apicola TaxID=2932184 RepID=A0AAU9CUT4_9LACO|nr:SemiSWEET family transporter [Xylocopilactobacillus apicola]BDR57764.1 membrane protein [Xylocopilactobacillus apicola]